MRVGASAGSSENSKEGAVFNPVTVRQRLEYIRLWVMWTILKIKKIVCDTSVTVGPRPSALPPPPQPLPNPYSHKLASTYLHLKVSGHLLYDFAK